MLHQNGKTSSSSKQQDQNEDLNQPPSVTFHTSLSPSLPPSLSSRGSEASEPGNDPEELKLLNEDLLGDTSEPLDHNIWKVYTDRASDGPFYLHDPLFKKGLVVFSDRPEPDITEMKFPLGDRQCNFVSLGEREQTAKTRSQATSSARIASQLHLFTQGSSIQKNKAVRTALSETSLGGATRATDITMDYYANEITKNKDLGIIVTEKRSDEMFFPFNFTDMLKSTQTGLYVYPWPSLASAGVQVKEEFVSQFTGFTDFFTGSCLLGSTLQGIDQYQNSFSLIKADPHLYPGQVIVKIHHETALQLHGMTQLHELEKQISLASQMAKEEKSNNIRFHYHLPGYDYLLIGAELYLKGQMTLPAFESFCYVVLKHQAIYASFIEKISVKYSFPITIVNPYQLIFDQLPVIDFLANHQKEEAKKALGAAVLQILKISAPEENTSSARSDKVIEPRTCDEINVIRNFLSLIKKKYELDPTNTLAIVWNDFIECAGPIDSLKDLGHIGNTVMIGAIAHNKAPHSVCAFHPVSEKYIFIQYGKFIKHQDKKDNPSWKAKYPIVMCATIMNPVQPHSRVYTENRGQTFYYNRRARFLLDTTQDLGKQLKLLEKAGENIAQNALSPQAPR